MSTPGKGHYCDDPLQRITLYVIVASYAGYFLAAASYIKNGRAVANILGSWFELQQIVSKYSTSDKTLLAVQAFGYCYNALLSFSVPMIWLGANTLSDIVYDGATWSSVLQTLIIPVWRTQNMRKFFANSTSK